jgi:hypothetical protein
LQWLLQSFYLVNLNFRIIFLILLLNNFKLYERILNIYDLNSIITDINYFENDKDILYFTNSKLNCYSKFKIKKFKNSNIYNLEENKNIKNVTFESIRKTFIFNLFVIVLTILVLIWDLFPNIYFKLRNYFISEFTFENLYNLC